MSNLTISNTTHRELANQFKVLADEMISILHGLRKGTIKSTSLEKRLVKALRKAGVHHLQAP